MSRIRVVLGRVSRAAVLGVLLVTTFINGRLHGWTVVAAVAGLLITWLAGWAFFVTTIERRLWPSVGLLALLIAAAAGGHWAGLTLPAVVLWCGCAVVALERLPLLAAVPGAATALTAYALAADDALLATVATTTGLALAGYVLRMDAEARASAQRLLNQERAARKAEAESAKLDERARIAREIHDVLAHSLSAQLVHLEAARLLIERDAERQQILERVVAARSMARDGLVETRQALSALRGEMSPLEDFLKELVSGGGDAEVTVRGERRRLPAEASQAVRRVAQEALTNARKHAPGARVAVLLDYGEDEVTLDVRDTGGPPGDLASSGGGYGLRGMRERAELLGGTLAAGPHEEGFVVTLKVPA